MVLFGFSFGSNNAFNGAPRCGIFDRPQYDGSHLQGPGGGIYASLRQAERYII